MTKIQKIRKRNGQLVNFDQEKITEAIWKAAKSIGGKDRSTAEKISSQVVTVLEVFYKNGLEYPSVEQIQDLVEKILIEGGYAQTAKAFILYREKHQGIRSHQSKILGGANTKVFFDDEALKTFAEKYLKKNEKNEVIETPEELFIEIINQISQNVDSSNSTTQEFFKKEILESLCSLEFLPCSDILKNRGEISRKKIYKIEENELKSLEILQEIFEEKDKSLISFQKTPAKSAEHPGPKAILKVMSQFLKVFKINAKVKAIINSDHKDILEILESFWEKNQLENYEIFIQIPADFFKRNKIITHTNVESKDGEFIESIEEKYSPEEVLDRIVTAMLINSRINLQFEENFEANHCFINFLKFIQKSKSNDQRNLTSTLDEDKLNKVFKIISKTKIQKITPINFGELSGNLEIIQKIIKIAKDNNLEIRSSSNSEKAIFSKFFKTPNENFNHHNHQINFENEELKPEKRTKEELKEEIIQFSKNKIPLAFLETTKPKQQEENELDFEEQTDQIDQKTRVHQEILNPPIIKKSAKNQENLRQRILPSINFEEIAPPPIEN